MNALGMIETVGMVAAVTAGDAAIKSADVKLIGYELTKGGGMVTIKFVGNVAAVNAALESASIEAEKVNRVVSKHIIPRPHDDLEKLINNIETIGAVNISRMDSEPTDIEKVSYSVDFTGFSIEDSDANAVSSKQIRDKLEVQQIAENQKVERIEKDQKDEQIGIDQKVEQIEEEQIEFATALNKIDEKEVCNICKDPECTRRKGELRLTCIHYKK
ncbi:BMC domain-containing protein [Sporosarcina sp. 179-K 3D1 HS]|uniref:BMC domain-containing protein n=1 Tax=Sporosarcina sp. 179-K 3D1 HS TaxID=3232169 RepID=UPI0039A0828A